MKVFIILTILIILGGTRQKGKEEVPSRLAKLVLYTLAIWGTIVLVINWNVLNWFY